MPVIEWPTALKHHEDIMPWVEGGARSAGRSVTGTEVVSASGSGYLRYSITTMMWGVEKTLAWRALWARAQGRLNIVRVPIWDRSLDLVTTSGLSASRDAAEAGNGLPFSSGVFFSSGIGWKMSFGLATLAESAALGATSLSVTFPAGMVPQPGQFLCVGRSRLYTIADVVLQSGTTYNLKLNLRLRNAVTAGSQISFDELYCLMRLSDESMLKVARDPNLAMRPMLEFVEAL
jgi:hypothetical protein